MCQRDTALVYYQDRPEEDPVSFENDPVPFGGNCDPLVCTGRANRRRSFMPRKDPSSTGNGREQSEMEAFLMNP